MNELRDTQDEVQKQRCQICTEDMKVVRVGCVLSCGHNGHVGDATELLSKLESSLAVNREQKAEIERLKIAGGLSCELHGCASADCATSQYLADAEKLIAELERLRASVGEKWIEIKEGCEMPMSGDRVLVHEHGTVFFAYFQSARKSWIGDLPDVFLDSSDGHFTAVTHWRPLPVAPTLPGEEK